MSLLKTELNQLTEQLIKADAELVTIQEYRMNIMNRRGAIKEQLIEANFTAADILDEHSAFIKEKRERFFGSPKFYQPDQYRIRDNWGYFPETNQRQLELQIYKKADDEHLEQLITVLKNDLYPLIKPFETEVESGEFITAKPIKIFEHTCSEDGVYDLLHVDDKYILRFTRYRLPKAIFKTESLMQMLKRIRNNHWY